MDKSRHIKKESILEALEKSLGVVTIALDFGESQLHSQIEKGNTSATIFFLKTKGKKRGYIERSELDLTSGDEPIKINVNIKGVEH
jgi:hypothetical protein